MIRIRDIKLPVTCGMGDLIEETAKILCLDKIYPGNSYPGFSLKLLRKSTDARRKPDIYFVYTVLVLISDEDEKKITGYLRHNRTNPKVKRNLDRILTDPVVTYNLPECGEESLALRPVVVGAGPAGLFCSLALAMRGFNPILVERGEDVDSRSRTVDAVWNGESVPYDSNVSFGEGGAGTFSDGKLTTLTKDTNGRNTFVLQTFARYGAPEEITYEAKPHIGTDILKSVVKNIREEIIRLGGEVCFNTRLADIDTDGDRLSSVTLIDVINENVKKIKTNACILCTGHSARDTFEMLYSKNIRMSQKNFAVGFRVIHPQTDVNFWQYGICETENTPLAPADYKVANETAKGRRVYSFCMCPGGYVVNASSENNGICVNGMSEYKRDGKYANSAIIAAVTPDDFAQNEVPSDHPLAGMYYQRNIEDKAYERGKGSIPIQSFGDYEKGIGNSDIKVPDDAVKGRVFAADLRGIYSEDIDEAIIESMHKFGYTRKGFDDRNVLMLGVEARTSSPIRIERDENLESNIKGLYPCGEGAGYAGGIVSAAADGLRCAEQIILRYRSGE